MIKAILLIVYLYGFLPLLIGAALFLLSYRTPSSSSKQGYASIYVSGYVVYLALFELLIICDTHRQESYNQLVTDWKRAILFITLISIVCLSLGVYLFQKRKGNSQNMSDPFKGTVKNNQSLSSYKHDCLIFILITMFLTILAILFLVPHALDDTPELARMTLSNDRFFSVDPLTGLEYAENAAYPGPIHLLYAFGSTITGIDVTTLIHLVMPLFMIPFFICCYVIIARLLFPDKKDSRDRTCFVLLVILFYLLMLPLEAHIALSPYRNIWNGTTLAGSCLFPLLCAICLVALRSLITQHTSNSNSIQLLKTLINIICLSLAIKLCVSYGVILCMIFVLSSIVITIGFIISLCKNNRSSERGTFSSTAHSEGGARS